MKKIFKKRFLITIFAFICLSMSACGSNGSGAASKTTVNPQDAKWTLSQYVDESGSQGMFYTLENQSTGSVVVIDGGNKGNTDQVRKVLKEKGNKVAAWFLTHYHPDHVDALNEILADPQDLLIAQIYVSPIDYERYITEAKPWDGPDSYTRFRELTKESKNIISCNRRDVYEIDGLKVKVLNTYDDTFVKANTGDIHNNASLVLRFETKNDSLLIMADTSNTAIAKLLEDNYKSDLKSTYFQPGHHGNNTIDYSFYDLVSPKVAFFDGPEWLVDSDDYRAKPLIKHFSEKGIKCCDYRTGTNTFVME